MEKFQELIDFLKHPIDYIVHHSKDHIHVVDNHNKLIDNYVRLAGNFHIQRENKEDLEFEVGELNEIIIPLEEDNSYLKRQLDKRNQDLKRIKCDVEDALEVCRYVRTGEDVLEARMEENKSANNSLNDWLNGPRKVSEAREMLAIKQSETLEGYAFGGRVASFINQNPLAKNKAIAFYDFVNNDFYYNNLASKLLGIHPNKSYMALSQLFRCFKNEKYEFDGNLSPEIKKKQTKRKYLVRVLQEGKEVDNFPMRTSEKNNRVYLSTRPIKYISRKGAVRSKKAFGFLMLFEESSLFGLRKPGEKKEEKQGILNELELAFEDIYESCRKINGL